MEVIKRKNPQSHKCDSSLNKGAKNREKIETEDKEMRKQKGITLVALVVTIIVLIILAGVTLNIVLDQDGIINKAKQAEE